MQKQKLYCYVDESGQDVTSQFFIVIAVICINNQEQLRRQLTNIEDEAKTHGLKWQKTEHKRRLRYLIMALQRRVAAGSVYLGVYPKPVPYFSPVLYVVERAIRHTATENYSAKVRVDGINKTIARALTNALRAQGISAQAVKGKRDETEPLIRLADMWAGCARSALLNEKETADILTLAKQSGYLREVTT